MDGRLEVRSIKMMNSNQWKSQVASAAAVSTLAPPPPLPPNSDNDNEHILRTKQVLERLFPNVPSTDIDYETWLENLSSYIEQQHQQQQQQENHVKSSNSNPTAATTTANANNHQHNGDGSSSSDENITGNGTHHSTGDSQDDDSELRHNLGKAKEKKPVEQILRKYREENEDGTITWGFENDDGSFKEEIENSIKDIISK